MGSWSEIEIKSTGKYLKIENGTPHQLRLLSEEPIEKRVHGFGKEQVSCTGEGCLKCSEGSEVKQRFSANVFDHNSGKVLVWDFSGGIARQLKEIATTLEKDSSSLLDVDLKVSSSGSGLQKKYMVMPWMPPKPLPKDLKLHDLRDGSETPF